MRAEFLCAAVLAASALAFQPVKIEVASVKPGDPGATSMGNHFSPGRFTLKNYSLMSLIEWAYGLKEYQIIDAPGWLRSEMMLDNWGVAETNWRSALDPDRGGGLPTAPPSFADSESPRFVGRGVAAIAADAARERWNQSSVTSADLAREYGFTDIDGRQPDGWT